MKTKHMAMANCTTQMAANFNMKATGKITNTMAMAKLNTQTVQVTKAASRMTKPMAKAPISTMTAAVISAHGRMTNPTVKAPCTLQTAAVKFKTGIMVVNSNDD